MYLVSILLDLYSLFFLIFEVCFNFVQKFVTGFQNEVIIICQHRRIQFDIGKSFFIPFGSVIK